MAYILHLIDAQDVNDSNSAEKFITEQRGVPPNSNGKFIAFVEDISRTYPDLSEDDEDGDNDENLWEEGLDDRASYGNVKELVVKVDVTDETVVAALVASAVRCGLKLYDSEGQVVYPE